VRDRILKLIKSFCEKSKLITDNGERRTENVHVGMSGAARRRWIMQGVERSLMVACSKTREGGKEEAGSKECEGSRPVPAPCHRT